MGSFQGKTNGRKGISNAFKKNQAKVKRLSSKILSIKAIQNNFHVDNLHVMFYENFNFKLPTNTRCHF